MIFDADPYLDVYVKAAMGMKAENLTVLDVRGLTSLADVFILCSGRSTRQVSAIADHIRMSLKRTGIRPLSVEGLKEGHWVLLDYGHVILHVFLDAVRAFYDLDGLWTDAKRIGIDDIETADSQNVERERHDDA